MEYKFRGFDATGQKGWVYGDLVHNKKVTKTGLEDRIMVGDYEVVPESVGICTGRKDINGRLIFEGDEVVVNSEIRGEKNKKAIVAWSDDVAGFVYHVVDDGQNYFFCGNCEVV